MVLGRTRDVVYCGLFSALMVVGAYIKLMLPVGIFSVTFSLQLLFALLAGLLLGARLGGLSVCAYLLMGIIGLPVFAHGGGLGYIARPTFGFLIGFALAAYVSGRVAESLSRRGAAVFIGAAVAGEAVYYIAGLVYYFVMYNYVLTNGVGIGAAELLTTWCLSTLIPDTVLSVCAANAAQRLYHTIMR